MSKFFRVKNNTIPSALDEKFQLIQHNYRTNFSKNNYKESKLNLMITKFAISPRGPRLWIRPSGFLRAFCIVYLKLMNHDIAI